MTSINFNPSLFTGDVHSKNLPSNSTTSVGDHREEAKGIESLLVENGKPLSSLNKSIYQDKEKADVIASNAASNAGQIASNGGQLVKDAASLVAPPNTNITQAGNNGPQKETSSITSTGVSSFSKSPVEGGYDIAATDKTLMGNNYGGDSAFRTLGLIAKTVSDKDKVKPETVKINSNAATWDADEFSQLSQTYFVKLNGSPLDMVTINNLYSALLKDQQRADVFSARISELSVKNTEIAGTKTVESAITSRNASIASGVFSLASTGIGSATQINALHKDNVSIETNVKTARTLQNIDDTQRINVNTASDNATRAGGMVSENVKDVLNMNSANRQYEINNKLDLHSQLKNKVQKQQIIGDTTTKVGVTIGKTVESSIQVQAAEQQKEAKIVEQNVQVLNQVRGNIQEQSRQAKETRNKTTEALDRKAEANINTGSAIVQNIGR